MGVTSYRGPESIYFRRVLKCCSKLGKFVEFPGRNLLDFGCGTKELKKYVSKMNYFGYDLDPKLSEVDSWDEEDFHTVVINHTLMYLDTDEISKLFVSLRNNRQLNQVIIGIGRQNVLSKIGTRLLRKRQAHYGTVTEPNEQKKLIAVHFNLVRKKSIFFMTDVMLLEPKRRA
jgi:hypothetical protein